jgi:hypothetical protein
MEITVKTVAVAGAIAIPKKVKPIGVSVSVKDHGDVSRGDDSVRKKRKMRTIHVVLGVLWIVIAVWSLSAGLEYYRLPLWEKAYSPQHDLFKPAGLVGHGFGIFGSLFMIVGVSMYSLRKRYSRLHGVGKLRNWLTVHIFLCTLGPYLVMLHTAFRFGGIISIAFWSMALVVGSGVFGRYVYTRIPKTVDGEFVSESLLRARSSQLVRSISTECGVPEEKVSDMLGAVGSARAPRLSTAVISAIQFDIHKRKLPDRFHAALADQNVGMASRNAIVSRMMEAVRLQQQVRVMLPFQRLFGYWHVFHLPLAVIMFLIMFLHVGVAFMFGYYWIG